jgi:hypothetical protein
LFKRIVVEIIRAIHSPYNKINKPATTQRTQGGYAFRKAKPLPFVKTGGLTFVLGEIVAQSFAHTLVEEDAHSCLGGQQLPSAYRSRVTQPSARLDFIERGSKKKSQ